MSKISRKRRRFQIRQKQKRRKKLKKLIRKYLMAKTEEEKTKILEKMKKISPNSPLEKLIEREKEKMKLEKEE